MKRYNPKEIEPKWQRIWDEHKTYVVNLDSKKPKYVGFGMFNYPSGAGIHVGHVRNFTIPDVVTRAKRQQGFESYQPVGWDSFGLPAENYAIKTGVSPQESTKSAIAKYYDQYKAMGWGVDWDKEINTTDPAYYKWTQWIFTKLFKHNLAYQKESMQWWCEHDKTVLADEQVESGKCWRCGNPVIKKNLKQWFFKITDYADKMLEATDDLDWTESVKASQKSWIGRSVGTEIEFEIDGTKDLVSVFTTRADTLFGASFLVLAPEHPLVSKITTEKQKAKIKDYAAKTIKKSEVQRQQDADKEKTGVFTGAYAINPANNAKIPIWIADYVLLGYGTGAIMAVPAHDERDNEFAKKFDLKILPVIEPQFGKVQGDEKHKNGIIALLRNPETDEFLVLNWGPRHDRWGGNLFVGGGIDDGEDIVAAAKREIAEETGYIDIDLVSKTTVSGHSYYYSNVKDRNDHAYCTGLVFDLKSNRKVEQKLDAGEKNKFTTMWVKTADIPKTVYTEGLHYWFFKELILGECYTGEGVMINSGQYNGMLSFETRDKITADLAKKNVAKEKVNYKMRDWLISRQRYWGAPIPIIHCDKDGAVVVPEQDLPVVLPEVKNYMPTGDNSSVLAGVEDWVNVDCPKCGGPAKRETDTMDGYVCSSWYFLRYLDPNNSEQAWDPEQTIKWMPIDFYNGGDHATAHLLYARFFTRFFHQLGLVSTPEPFKHMVFNGKIRASDGTAFSKSKGNGIDPLQVIDQGYGADSIRLYEMFAAPVELDVLWDEQGIPGSYRFLSRIWNLTQEYLEAKTGDVESNTAHNITVLAHKTIKKVTWDIEADRFNTAIAAMMEAVNGLYKAKEVSLFQSKEWKFALESIVQLVAPFAPHIAEELWHQLDHDDSVHVDHWPQWDEKILRSSIVTVVVQVNGKLRGQIELDSDSSQEHVEQLVREDEKIASYLVSGVKKVIFVPNKLINFVV